MSPTTDTLSHSRTHITTKVNTSNTVDLRRSPSPLGFWRLTIGLRGKTGRDYTTITDSGPVFQVDDVPDSLPFSQVDHVPNSRPVSQVDDVPSSDEIMSALEQQQQQPDQHYSDESADNM